MRQGGNPVTVELPAEVSDRLIGQVAPETIRTTSVPRHDASLVEILTAMPDMASAVADALDELGVGDVLGTAELAPVAAGMRVCGPAVTLRYVGVHGEPAVHRAAGAKLLVGDRDLYGVASAGDVAVVDCGGVRTAAVMGELSALWARKAGVAGCVVDGAVRDTASLIATGLPVWSRSRIPLAARHRVQAVAVNDVVSLAGVPVRPGDYVVADDDGICIVPFAVFPDIVAMCRRGQEAERDLATAIEQAGDLAELVRRLRSTTVAD